MWLAPRAQDWKNIRLNIDDFLARVWQLALRYDLRRYQHPSGEKVCTSIQESTPIKGILMLDKAPSPNPEAPARIVFQDRGELAEFQKGRSGRDIGPNPNAAGQQPSGRHLW